MHLCVNFVHEEKPGPKWLEIFDRTWPYYQKWFLSDNNKERPGYLTCVENFQKFLPELYPVYNEIVETAGGGDLAARYLSMFNPPAYMSGCTQLAWKKENVALIRNYDYDSKFFEGTMLYSNWLKPVIAMVDCNWGVLDGINKDGLSISLTFGGRNITGFGFGIPVVLRYLLETCSTVGACMIKLQKIPIHMSYNLTIVDASGDFATVFLSPDRPITTSYSRVTANHQSEVEWMDYAILTSTRERENFLNNVLNDPAITEEQVVQKFFQKPVYQLKHDKGLVTLYTALYHPQTRDLQIMWPDKSVFQSFDYFTERKVYVTLGRPVSGKLTL
ncbi:MAG TPA: C45 family peptidase [Cyclobacteriaceae bacterium]|jgi:predicted choloylglycine hydrolase